VLLAVSGWIALAATALPPLSPPRVLTTLLFVAIAPGIAALRTLEFLRPAGAAAYEPALAATLVVTLSLALATLASQSLVLAGVFTMTRCAIALAVLTTVLSLTPTALRRRRPAC
jgi:hypothetical protein